MFDLLHRAQGTDLTSKLFHHHQDQPCTLMYADLQQPLQCSLR